MKAVTDKEEKKDNVPTDATAALLGTPVDQRRRIQGKSLGQYLRDRPGDRTKQAFEAAGVARLQKRRVLLFIGAALVCLLITGSVIAWVVMGGG